MLWPHSFHPLIYALLKTLFAFDKISISFSPLNEINLSKPSSSKEPNEMQTTFANSGSSGDFSSYILDSLASDKSGKESL